MDELRLNVNVEHLGDGRTTQLFVAEGTETSSIFAVKQRIEEVEGIKVEAQRLLRHDCNDEMADNIVLHASCTLQLWIGEARFGWDPRTAHEISDIYVQSNPRTYTRVGPPDPRNGLRTHFFMSIYPPMVRCGLKNPYSAKVCQEERKACNDVHTISLRFHVDHDKATRVFCGVTRGPMPLQVEIPFRSVLTMRLDFKGKGKLTYFVDGVRTGKVQADIPLRVMTWTVLGPPEVSAYEIVQCEDDLVTIKH
jgi:hypothetical protein